MEVGNICEEINDGKVGNNQFHCGTREDSNESTCNTKVEKLVDEKIVLNDGLSKKQRKRLMKREKWLQVRKLKRIKEKEKQKQKKKNALQNNIKLGPSRKELKYNKMSGSQCKVRVVIDLSFNDLMNDKDIGKCVKQIHHCYSVNRRHSDPMQFYLTSFNGRLEEDMEKHDGFRNWDINFSSEHFTKLFQPNELVYLTSDSENVITSLEDDKVYIIGGLVDHNSQKGLCLRVAKDTGISHAQLPIGEFLQMATRKTLTIDHVFEIMHGVWHGKTWEEALLQVIPARKGAQAKDRDLPKDSSEESHDGGIVAPSEEESKAKTPVDSLAQSNELENVEET
ncbi:tRNA methyltransferase 10 homolog A isoform X2 [Hetaerina americana]|uniref:tRNA methyltransferase 10 homolog A isoform X2 n=1 Tax=Hetaerina americana TaxID=62018 RepID=UPI003A7F49F5